MLFGLGCSGEGKAPGLDDFLPEVPPPTGEAQSVWAGAITGGNTEELIDGPAAAGMVGDYFMRNGRVRFVIQAPARVIGVVPQGGNLVDAVPVRPGEAAEDHFGELSLMYLLGRTCEHREIEVVEDGSGGGAAVLRARGLAAANDFINFRGIGLFNISPDQDPDVDDRVECATTYVLEPDASHLRVLWTLYNPGDTEVKGPMGSFSDVGGVVDVWAPTRGFERLGIQSVSQLNMPAPIDYAVYQGPNVAYGLVPRHADRAAPNAQFLISGVSVMLFGADVLLDILEPEAFYLQLSAGSAMTEELEVVVGRDSADVEERFRAGRGEAVAEVAGQVIWAGAQAASARVGLFEDRDGDGLIGPRDAIRGYMDTAEDGRFSGKVPPGNYLLAAEVQDLSRSASIALEVSSDGVRDLSVTLPDPVFFDYRIVDPTGTPLPARLTVLGRHPAEPDIRLFDLSDRAPGTVRTVHSVYGTSDGVDRTDPPLALPAGGTYRLIASRGTEWSVADALIEPGMPGQLIELTLHHVAPADGYVSSEYHVHQLGSPDSPVSNERRVASMVAEGMELFAATDHDFVSDLQPAIEQLGVAGLVRAIAGLEVTPFAYGHFNAWPIIPDDTSPNFGAIDWARGMDGYAMIPGEIFAAMRARGAEMVQVNHPRSTFGGISFLQFFDRAGLLFDYDNRQITGDLASAPVPSEWLRLPGVSLWDDSFNALEVWNQMQMDDANEDGVREIAGLDIVMRDWFNFLSFGLEITPMGNSDTHSAFSRPPGMPRTYVRVGDDSARALESGEVVPDVLATLSGAANRDVVVTNGPHIRVVQTGGSGSAIGAVIDGTSGTVSFAVEVVAPDWASFDTLEIFANATPDVEAAVTTLQPLVCYTSRSVQDMADNDICRTAALAPQSLNVRRAPVAGGSSRYEASATVDIAAGDIAIVNRAGASGADAWLVFRVRGSRAVFPLILDGAVTEQNLDVLVTGASAEVEAAMDGVGIPATAFTAPVYVDFDGGGYTAVFRPR